jgi:hypothetical protein
MHEIVKSTQDAMSIGEVFFKSGMFSDIKSAQQAVVKILAGSELGIPPFAAMSGIHIIAGKPTIGAGLMAAKIKGSNKYDYKVVQSDEKACIIDFYEGKDKIGTSTFTIEDAKKAGTKNIDKYPKNMLFARAISNGVKWFTPDIYDAPVYVPEEMQDIQTIETEAIVITDPLEGAKAIATINACNDIEVLEATYKSLPTAIQRDKAVIAAAKERKALLTDKTTSND